MQPHHSRIQALTRAVGVATLAVASLAFVASAHAQQAYGANFNNFAPNSTLSGQPIGVTPNWDTNDADNGAVSASNRSIGQSDFVGFINGYSTGPTDYWASLGGLQHSSPGGGRAGVLPGASNVFLFNNFTLGTVNRYSFDVDFAIPQSSSISPANDQFAWTFRNGATNLFSIDFVPNAPATNPLGTPVNFALRYTVGGSQSTTLNGVVSSSIYHLNISVNVAANSFVISLTPTNNTAPFISGPISLGGADPLTVSNIAATWLLADTSNISNGGYENAGSNALIFDNYFVTVPEPSTWAMTGLAACGLATVVYRRRARA